MLGGLGNLESIYNFRLIWRLLDGVAKSLTEHRFVPGEVRLDAIKNELARRGLSLSSYYDADGLITNDAYKVDLVLLETSGPFGASNDKKKTLDHIKAAYGLLAMLHTIAYKYNYADIKLFKKLKVAFVHGAGDKIRLWTLNLADFKLYILNRQRSCQVPTTHVNNRSKVVDVINMMWELQVRFMYDDKLLYVIFHSFFPLSESGSRVFCVVKVN